MKVMFFGLGSIGKRHARLIKENFNHELYAYRSSKNSEKNDLGITEIYNLGEIDQIKPDAAFITNPTDQHIKYATFCAKRGIHLFIEKPISNDKKGLEELSEIIIKKGISSYVGYVLRFHPVVVWLKKYLKNHRTIHITVNTSSYLPNWRKNINHLEHYSAFKDQGGGAILELSHEIDYLYHLFGEFKEVKINSKKAGSVTVDAEDFADLLIEFKNGIFANLHIDFFSRNLCREIIADFDDSTLICDLIENKITKITDEETSTINFDTTMDDIYLSQLRYFFSQIDNPSMAMNGIVEAAKVFNIILKVKKEVK